MIPPRDEVNKIGAYHPPLEGRRANLRLDFNENTIGPSPKVLEVLKNIRPEYLASYPEYSEFKEKLAQFLNIKTEQLAISNATDEALSLVMQTYLGKGEEIIIPVPTFAMFKYYAQVAGGNITEVLYNDDLSFPTQNVFDTLSDNTKIVVLCTPNNPTGTAIGKEDAIKIIEKAKETETLVLIDEAYAHFHESLKDLINTYDNVVVVQTFSKAFGLAGLRIGYLMSNKENIANIQKVASPYSVNALAVACASAAIDDDAYVQDFVKQVLEAKQYALEECKKLDIKTVDSDANFFLCYFGDQAKDIQDQCRENGILVRDRSADQLLEGYVRITVGTMDQMKEVIATLKEILKK